MLGFQVQEGIKDMEGANANILTHLGPMYSRLLSPTPLPGHRRADITQTYVGGKERLLALWSMCNGQECSKSLLLAYDETGSYIDLKDHSGLTLWVKPLRTSLEEDMAEEPWPHYDRLGPPSVMFFSGRVPPISCSNHRKSDLNSPPFFACTNPNPPSNFVCNSPSIFKTRMMKGSETSALLKDSHLDCYWFSS